MKKIMILTLLFSPFAYGFRAPRVSKNLPSVTVKNGQIIVAGRKGKIALPVIQEALKNVPEEAQMGIAQAAEAVEGCGKVCFQNMINIANKKTPSNSPEYKALQAIRYSPVYLKGQDAAVIRKTIERAQHIIGVQAEEKQGALINASFISRDWNDPVAQNKIPETALAWADESDATDGVSTLLGTMVVFDLDSEEQAEQREEDIIDSCQAVG